MQETLLHLALLLGTAVPVGALQDDAEIEAIIQAEREEADLLRRRGKYQGARALLLEHLDEEPGDTASRLGLARVEVDMGRLVGALEHYQQALTECRVPAQAHLAAECLRGLIGLHLTLGQYEQALGLLSGDSAGAGLSAEADARSAWVVGRSLLEVGEREAAAQALGQGLEVPRDSSWEQLLARGRCERALGRLTDASRSFVAADRTARSGLGTEPDVLVALADLYFESEREVEASSKRSAGDLYREALELHPTHEGALLGLFELHRYNRRRVSRSPGEILGQLLATKPQSVAGLLAKASADLSDGQLVSVRLGLARLAELAPGRRELRALEAALAWVEHRRTDCERILDELLENARMDSRPELAVGRHLTELYRFSEALGFLERATSRNPSDYEAWTWYARSLANVGRESEAREALAQAKQAAAGRQDAWRNNMDLVLRRMSEEQVSEVFGELSFAWTPESAGVLRTYLLPFYSQAREELAARYGHTPGPTNIEVFRRHQDFSVRSVGFAGFPALGVCFGPVVTALSPLSEMRGSFSWARTGFHEFSHVVHLGLSHNRCPRWITEGLATWEEVNRNPAWTRNMRRDLLDARAQENLIPVRELNRAFRGPRILFGYYQGGLLCQMLIEDHGFSPMIRLLQAFDRGLDLDTALDEVFGKSPEELDAQFKVWVDSHLEGLVVEPRWGTRQVARARLTLGDTAPSDPGELEAWREAWVTVAWGSWQQGRRLDAEEALRLAGLDPRPSARALFLKGEMALARERRGAAIKNLEQAVELGGRDFRGLLALGSLLAQRGELDRAEGLYLLAEEAFPGYDHPELSAERKLAALYKTLDRPEDSMMALERWLRWNPGNYDVRKEVADWHAAAGRHAPAVELYREANEVDPFRRDLHRAWADSLVELELWADAEREARVTLDVPAGLDLDHLRYAGDPSQLPPGVDPDDLPVGFLRGLPGDQVSGSPLNPSEQAGLLRLRARCLRELDRIDEAQALEADADALARKP